MDEREGKKYGVQSWYLGARIASHVLGVPFSHQELQECLDVLGELARGETTLYDPNISPGAPVSDELRTNAIMASATPEADQEVATLLCAGLHRGTTTEENASDVLPLPSFASYAGAGRTLT